MYYDYDDYSGYTKPKELIEGIIDCPYCGNDFKVDIDWIEKNKRVFCTNCCKAFDFEKKPSQVDYDGCYD